MMDLVRDEARDSHLFVSSMIGREGGEYTDLGYAGPTWLRRSTCVWCV